MEKQRIGIGMIGTGFMCKAHTNAYRTIPYVCGDAQYRPELAALCGRDLEKTREKAALYGYRTAYSGWSEMLRDPSVDVVDVCSTDQTHAPAVLDAIRAGKNVLCEKPLALSAEQAGEMYRAARDAGIVHMVSFNYRFLPAVRLAYLLIRDGVIGEPRHMRVKYYQQGGADGEQPIEDTWYARPPKSGVLQGIGTHAIDQARFLLGEIASLSAVAGTYVKTRPDRSGGRVPVEVEESAEAAVQFAGGATGIVECSCVAWGRKNQLAWEIYGSRGSLSFDLESPNYLNIYLEKENSLRDGFAAVNVTGAKYPFMQYWWPEGHNLGWEHAHINLLAHYLDCVARRERPDPLGATFEDGYRAAVIVDAIRESARGGNRIDLLPRYEVDGRRK